MRNKDRNGRWICHTDVPAKKLINQSLHFSFTLFLNHFLYSRCQEEDSPHHKSWCGPLGFFFFYQNYTRPLFLSKSEPEDTHHSQWIYCDDSIHTCTNTYKRTERVKDRGGERAHKHSYCRQCYMIKGDGERRGNECSKNGSAADSVSPGSHSLQIHTHTRMHARSALHI